MKKFLAVLFSTLLFMPVLAFAHTTATSTTKGIGHVTSLYAKTAKIFLKAGVNASSTVVSLTTVTGTVTSVSGESITLNGSNSTTYTVDATNAKIYRKYGAVMAITQIQTNDSLSVRGTNNSGTITATTIRDMSQQQVNATFSGSVASLNGSSFVLNTKNRGAQAMNTSSTTVFDKNGKVDSNGLADIVVGSNVTASGVWDSTSSTTAVSKVNLIVRNVVTTGVVNSISAPDITITTKNGTAYTVDTTNAKFVRRYGAAMAITDIEASDTLAVTGVVNGANITATTVRDESLQAHNGTFSGSVTALNGSSFTLQSNNRGPQTINTTNTTVFRLGTASTSISSLAVGQTVTVSGVWDRTSSNVTASRVTIKVASLSITGTLQAINGTQLTVSASSTTYSVDASSAKIRFAHNHSGSLSTFQVNDQVKVWGKATSGSTNILATIVQDLSRTYTGTSTPQ